MIDLNTILTIPESISPLTLSIIIFAGVSQIVFAQLFSTFTPSFIIVGTIGIVNLRHILYGVSLSSYLKKLSLKWRVILSYLITDEAFAISYKRFSEEKKTKDPRFAGPPNTITK